MFKDLYGSATSEDPLATRNTYSYIIAVIRFICNGVDTKLGYIVVNSTLPIIYINMCTYHK